MPNTFDYDGYTDSLRKTHADGMAEARKHPKAEQHHLDMQELFTEPQVQFGVALAKLQRMEGSDQHKVKTIGTALGSMYGDVTMSLLRNGRFDLLAELDEAVSFARMAIVQHQTTGEAPAGTLVQEGSKTSNFEMKDGN